MSGDLSQLMARAQEAQQKLQALQQELSARRVEGSSGGGMVKASVTGGLRVLDIQIEPQLLESRDRDMLQDLVAAAVNAALGNASASFNLQIPTPGEAP
jgi:DNA-binding YbaB/EbfC family protein